MEHHSNIVPWHFHRERKGAVIKWAPVADDGTFLARRIREAADRRARKIVAITHMSNVLGTVVPIKEVCRIAHARGIPVLVDGSQGAVHLPVDVQRPRLRLLLLHRPQALRPDRHRRPLRQARACSAPCRPIMGGGEMIRDVTEDCVTYAEPPHRFEAGTPPIVQAIGLGAALDYVEGIGRERIAAHEAELARLRPGAPVADQQPDDLRRRPRARARSSPSTWRAPIPTTSRRSSTATGIAVRAGTHCAQPLLARYGVDGDLPRLLRPLQHARRGRPPCRGSAEGA